MIVIMLSDCPPKVRGDLSKWLCEINTGVFVGNVSSRVREEVWQRICENIKSGQATMVFSAPGEQKMDFRVHNTTWEPVDLDGIKLMRRPLPAARKSDGAEKEEQRHQGAKSRAEQLYMAERMAKARAKKQFQEGLSAMIDMDQLESQVSKIIGNYMNQAMGTMGNAIGQTLETQVSSAMTQIIGQMTTGLESAMKQMMTNVGTQLQNSLGNAMQIDPIAFADAFQMNMTEDDLAELMMSMSGKGLASYDSNLQKLGYVDFAVPSAINIYPKDFEGKEQVVKILDDYNSRMEAEGKDEQVITYTDVVGTLMSSVTTIVDTISYVLIAFVAISLVVSSIMIGVITYISVLERKKEIGILRAIGASKRNVSQVFNAETFIIGLCAGLIGIGLTLLLLIPGNAIIHNVADNAKVNAVLPIVPAIILILLSVVLTLLGGLIPSKKAAKSDPVTALRTE